MLASCREAGGTVSAAAAFIFPKNRTSAEETGQSLWTVENVHQPSIQRKTCNPHVVAIWQWHGNLEQADPGKEEVHPIDNHATPGARFPGCGCIKKCSSTPVLCTRQYDFSETHRLSKPPRSPFEARLPTRRRRIVATEKRKRWGPKVTALIPRSRLPQPGNSFPAEMGGETGGSGQQGGHDHRENTSCQRMSIVIKTINTAQSAPSKSLP
jgi:hypothetical protein